MRLLSRWICCCLAFCEIGLLLVDRREKIRRSMFFVSKLAVKKKRKPKSLFWRTKYNLICVLDCCAFGSGIWVLWHDCSVFCFCGLLEYLHRLLFVCSFLNVYILMLLVFSCRWRVLRSWGVARVGSWLAQFFYLARLCRRTAKVRTSFCKWNNYE